MKQSKFSKFAALLLLSAINVSTAVMNSHPAFAAATKEKVSFPNKNIQLAGEIYLPNKFDSSKEYPAIVVVHPGGGVKEQTAGIYAQKLADKGFVTLTFDSSYQGESGGEPRLLEDPEARVEDIRCAVDFLTTRPFVNNDAIGGLGICAGGGYTVHAAETEARLKVIATVSAVDSGRTRREGLGGKMTDEGRNKLLAEIGRQRTIEANGGEVRYIHYVPNSLEEVPDGPNRAAFKEYYDYYRTPRGMHPNSPNLYRFTSLDKMFAYTAFDHVDWISPRPLLLIAGSKAASRYLSEDAYKMAKNPRELYIIPNATHIDLYDVPQYVDKAVTKLNSFYKKYL